VTDAEPTGGRPRDQSLDATILQATRRRLIKQGYAQMTIADIAADAGVTRPTVYRRWPDKLTLVSDALDYALTTQRSAYNWADEDKTPFKRFHDLVRRADPCFTDPDALALEANLLGEAPRTPELLKLLTTRAVNPRLSPLDALLTHLKEAGTIRPDTDIHTVTTMIQGAFFAAHLRGTPNHPTLADQIATQTWTGLRNPH
jgi:AcrR family transcriptional regulator